MRRNLSLVLGVLMVALGLYALLWPLVTGAPVSSSRWLDLGFAAFFLVRGGFYLRTWRRAKGGPLP